MAVMKSTDFIKKLKEIEALPTTYYSVAGGKWAAWNGRSWNFDCVILIKAILWGWNGNKNHSHGGAKYASNGVYDDNADQLVKRCTNVQTRFDNLIPGEALFMPGHVGVYIGGGLVIECTAAWEGKVVYSNVGTDGKRSRNGKVVGYWKKHGKLQYIDYVEEPKTESKPTPAPQPTSKKFKKGDKVVLTGYLYKDSQGNGQGQYKKDYRCTITIVADGSKPYHVDSLGWVAENNLKLQGEASKPKVYKTICNCTWLNMRSSASYGNNVRIALPSGTMVEYLGMENGWAKVKYDGVVLYCGSSYLR